MFGVVGVADTLLSSSMLEAIPSPMAGEELPNFAGRVADAARGLGLGMMQVDHFLLAAAHRSTLIAWSDTDESLYAEGMRHEEFPDRHSIHYHGGPAGIAVGTRLLPRSELESGASPAHAFHDHFSAGNVYVTQDRDIASHYARDSRRHKSGTVYRVRVKAIRPDPLFCRLAQLHGMYHRIAPGFFWPYLFESLVAEEATVVMGFGPEPSIFVRTNWF